jgi:uncharacterized protein
VQIPVQIDVNGQAILGILHVPLKRAVGSPIIILCYGFNGNRVENNRMSVFLGRLGEECGIILFRFDYRGLGVSEGEFWSTSILNKTEDALAVLEYLKGCFQGETYTLIALGFSDGIRIITNLINSCKDIVGICMWSPILFPVIDKVHEKHARRLMREPITKEMVMPFRGLWVGRQYLKQQSDIGQDFDIVKNFNHHRLVIFGENDPLVTETYEKLTEVGKDSGENMKIVMIPFADHLFSRVEWSSEVIRKTLDWAIDVGINNSSSK